MPHLSPWNDLISREHGTAQATRQPLETTQVDQTGATTSKVVMLVLPRSRFTQMLHKRTGVSRGQSGD
jgi:hypothetical protein